MKLLGVYYHPQRLAKAEVWAEEMPNIHSIFQLALIERLDLTNVVHY